MRSYTAQVLASSAQPAERSIQAPLIMGEQPAQVFLLGNLNFQPPKRKPISTYSEITESRITEDGMEPEPRTPKHRGLRSPAKLGRVGWNLVGEIAFHVFFLLLTFSFIILIAGVSYMNGRPVSNHDSRVLDQSTKMVSAYPASICLFNFVVGLDTIFISLCCNYRPRCSKVRLFPT